MRYAVLVSGRGSNLAALLAGSGQLGGPPVLVVSSRANAGALQHAAAAGVPTVVLPDRRLADAATAEAVLQAALEDARVEWVVLAGWMRILSDAFVHRWAARIVNIHPSLLPAFPGLHPHRQALAAGVCVTGCTVHRVAPGAVDGGQILAQAAVPVLPGDTEAILAARVLAAEHRLYVPTLAQLFAGTLRLPGTPPAA